MYIPNNYFGNSFEVKASTSYDNNDYVIWAGCGLVFGGKQLTRVSCQRLQNVSVSITAGKMSGRKRPASPSTRYNGLL